MFKILSFILIIFFSTSIYAITIKETIKSTIENNQKIRIGIEKINESKELIEKASGELLPDISSSISGTYETLEKTTSTSTTEDDTFSDTYKLTITQNLYDAGYNKIEIERSKILLDNEIINFKIMVQDLILDAITGYLTVLNYETSLDSNKKNYETMVNFLEETKIKYDVGAATLYDLQNAQSSLAIAETNLYSAEENLLLGKKSFKRIVGMEAIDLGSILDIDTDLQLKNIEINAMKNNLSIKLLNNDIENKRLLLLKEEKTKKPNLDLTGTAQYSDTDRIDAGTETTKSIITLTLTIPIFQQGIDDSNIRKYHSQILQGELNLQDKKEDLLINISNNYKDYKVNSSKMKANNIAIQASETALDSLKEEYLMGTKTISDLLDEEEKLLISKVNFFTAKKNYLISYFKIKSLEGLLLDNFKEYLPELD